MQTQLEIRKKVLDVIEISADKIRQDGREYNAQVWDEKIDRILKSTDVKFYEALPDPCYSYKRYFVVYTTQEGIRFFNDFGYSSCITSNGFAEIKITEAGEVFRVLLKDKAGNYGRCENDKANREIMARNTKNHGTIYSNNH